MFKTSLVSPYEGTKENAIIVFSKLQLDILDKIGKIELSIFNSFEAQEARKRPIGIIDIPIRTENIVRVVENEKTKEKTYHEIIQFAWVDIVNKTLVEIENKLKTVKIKFNNQELDLSKAILV